MRTAFWVVLTSALLRRCTTAPPPPPPVPWKVLACLVGADRGAASTFASFQKYVLNALDADLCGVVSLRRGDGPGAWRRAARYLDVFPEPPSLAQQLSPDAAAAAAGGGRQRAAAAAGSFARPAALCDALARARLLALIEARGLHARYSFFLVARTELLWLAPPRLPGAVALAAAPPALWLPFAGPSAEAGGLYHAALAFPAGLRGPALSLWGGLTGGGGGFGARLAALRNATRRPPTPEAVLAEWVAAVGLGVARFGATAFAVGARGGARADAQGGRTYAHPGEYAAALGGALAAAQAGEDGGGGGGESGGGGGGDASGAGGRAAPLGAPGGCAPPSRCFYVVGVGEAERVNGSLRGCALSAWGAAVHERLLSHPARARHAGHAVAVFAPPHAAWDFHWPVADGNVAGNAARADAHFPLPPEGAGYEPYGMRLSTSCRSEYAPCGYEGCVPAFGARAKARLLSTGAALSPAGLYAVLLQLRDALRLRPQQRLVFYDSGAAGPVALRGRAGAVGGYTALPPAAYADPRLAFALATTLRGRYRPGVDVSLPTPWSEALGRYTAHGGAPAARPPAPYLLTFKGNMATSRPYGNVRARARAALHDPRNGVVVVDSRGGPASEGAAYDYSALMFNTRFALILRGDQPYSYRFTEVVCSGAVPVLVAPADWVTPFEDAANFSSYGLLVGDDQLAGLAERLRSLPAGEEEALRTAAKRFCMARLVTVHAQVDGMVDSILRAHGGP